MLLGLVAWRRPAALRRITRREAAGAGAIGTVILGDIGLLALAEREVQAGVAVLVIASVPLWVVLLRLCVRKAVPGATLAGVAAGFAGVAVLVLPSDRPGHAPLGWLLVLVAAAAIEAGGQVAAQRTRLPGDALATTALQLLAAGAVLTAAGLAAGEAAGVRAGAISFDSLLAFAYLVGPGSLLAYTALCGCSSTSRSRPWLRTRT